MKTCPQCFRLFNDKVQRYNVDICLICFALSIDISNLIETTGDDSQNHDSPE
jgi:hypothetical protein